MSEHGCLSKGYSYTASISAFTDRDNIKGTCLPLGLQLCISFRLLTVINVTPSGLLCYIVMVYNHVNAGGVVSPEDTTDHEDKEQCIKMHEIINQYNLDGEFRYDSITHMSCQAICFDA